MFHQTRVAGLLRITRPTLHAMKYKIQMGKEFKAWAVRFHRDLRRGKGNGVRTCMLSGGTANEAESGASGSPLRHGFIASHRVAQMDFQWARGVQVHVALRVSNDNARLSEQSIHVEPQIPPDFA